MWFTEVQDNGWAAVGRGVVLSCVVSSSCSANPSPLTLPSSLPLPKHRKAVTTYEEGEAEYDLAFKVISHMIKREGLLVVVTAPRKQQGEGAEAYRNRVWKERRLALSPSYVPE